MNKGKERLIERIKEKGDGTARLQSSSFYLGGYDKVCSIRFRVIDLVMCMSMKSFETYILARTLLLQRKSLGSRHIYFFINQRMIIKCTFVYLSLHVYIDYLYHLLIRLFINSSLLRRILKWQECLRNIYITLICSGGKQ